MRARVLAIDHIHPAGIRLLEEYTRVTHLPQVPTVTDLIEQVRHYDVLVMRVTPYLDHRLFDDPGRLRLISVASVGLDHIPLDAAAAAGVRVVNQPGVNRDSVAEFAFGLLLNLARMIPQAAAELRAGLWNRNRYQHGIELAGRTLGIIGFGQTGTRMAEIAQGFRMRVLSYSPYTPDIRARKYGVQLTDLYDLVTESDVISVHCPLTRETQHLIGARELGSMRPGSYLLNLARGGVVDETALYSALINGPLAGAASDVFALEPAAENPLLTLPNFIGTPHVAGPTQDSLRRAGIQAAEAVLEFLGLERSSTESLVEVS